LLAGAGAGPDSKTSGTSGISESLLSSFIILDDDDDNDAPKDSDAETGGKDVAVPGSISSLDDILE
jgi:hypothetical protein